MTKIAAILFDKDGTLLDFDRTWEPVNRRASLFAAGGDPALADHIMRTCGMDPETGKTEGGSLFAAAAPSEIVAAMVEAGAPFSIEELTVAINRMFVEGAAHAVAVTDLEALFARLKGRGLRLGIASSDNEASIRRMAENMGIMPYIDYIAGYDSGHGVKPEPGMIDGFAAGHGLDHAEIAMVGDNTHDLHMARNARAGLAVGVLTGTSDRAMLSPHADHVLASIDDLEGLLDRLSAS
ncbi:HAD family hydrolase [Rhizobium sp. KVB221]|uniref:phosphoglycolate phosphatase n=1 Tax=Rhizobium setariae TaxID=2801340 RepID=A0A937CM71_9HYPH|nr:HAD family hydrolase [Rhizobium setariae]MBL0370599.1 HAD family hydrolase [Rhizobium setariae]